MPDLYLPQEVADLLKLSIHTLAAWRRSEGKGPPWIEVEGSIRYPKDQLNEWLASRTRNGAEA